MKNKLGVIVIGESPRPDCAELFGSCLREGDEVIVKGALDGLGEDELERIKQDRSGEILIALDRNLDPISVPERTVKERIPLKIREMEQEGATMITVNCSGQFERMESSVPLIMPGAILEHTVMALADGKRLGVLVPDPDQIERTKKQYKKLNTIPIVDAASPFGPREELELALRRVAAGDPELIVLDCTSFNSEIREFARNVTGKPVISAESVYLKTISDLAGR